ncbi:MAG: RNA polymerase Rpb4 family protein [Candidatus Micrarchaeota archaeon]
MIGKEVKDQRPTTLAGALKIMEERKKAGDLGFEQQTTYDYLKARKLLEEEDALKMIEELSKIEKLTPEIVIKIVDILPRGESQLKVLIAKERHTFNTAEMEEILKLVEKYAKE